MIKPFEKLARAFVAPNFAIGAVLMMQAAQLIAPHMPEAEIIEPENAAPRGWRRWLWPALGIGALGLIALQTYIYAAALPPRAGV